MLTQKFEDWSGKIEALAMQVWQSVQANAGLILALAAVALAAYGFELFNNNLTIDEEIHAVVSGGALSWVAIGRWGLYLLNQFLLPYTVVPFVPLFLALAFHIAAVVVLLECWQVRSKLDQVIVGAVCIAYPGNAYMYTFSVINYGIGFGLFCCAISLWIYLRATGLARWTAALPATFAFAVYPGFIVVIAAVFLVYLISASMHTSRPILKQIAQMVAIFLASLALNTILHKIALAVTHVADNPYNATIFSLSGMLKNLPSLWASFWNEALSVYWGAQSIYTLPLISLGLLLLTAGAGIAIHWLRSPAPPGRKLVSLAFSLGLFALPFLGGFATNGYYQMRFLISLSVTIAGLVMLGLSGSPRLVRILILLLAVYTVLMFVISTNRLFASSSLALQADRLVGSRLAAEIDQAKITAGVKDVPFLEVSGFLETPATQLIPKSETFGASFFEWDGGSANRIALFLQTIGVQGLQSLPPERRTEMMIRFAAMPDWPAGGSVVVAGDTVLIKFGPYSAPQKQAICATAAPVDFCP